MSALPVFLLDVTVKATAVLVAAMVLALLLRRAAAATRHAVWTLTLVGLLLLPPLALLPGWTFPYSVTAPFAAEEIILPADDLSPAALPAVAQARPVSAEPGKADALPERLPPAADHGQVSHAPASHSQSSGAGATTLEVTASRLLFGWAIGAGCFLTMIVLAFIGLHGRVRGAATMDAGELRDLMSQLAAELGIRRRIRLLEGGQRAMPMTWGVFRPSLLLPADAATWSAERRRVVLLHELGHVARWDCLTHLLGHVARCVYWFHPLAWWALARQRQEQEKACDDLVVTRGTAAQDYAEHLLSITAQLPPGYFAPALALGMARSSRLHGRLVALLDAARSRRPLRGRMLAALALLALGLLAPAASARWLLPPPPAAELPIAALDGEQPMPPELSKRIEEIRKKLREHYVGPLDERQLSDAAIKGLLQGVKDPYTDYIPAEQLRTWENQVQGRLVGIGAQLRSEDGRIIIVTPIDNSPALKAGLRAGDQIEMIDGQPARGLDVQEAVKRIVGKEGTVVKLKVVHADGEVKELAITRGPIRIPSVQGLERNRDGTWRHMLDNENKTGYVHISQFSSQTAKETRAAIEGLKKDGLKGLILDLRFCPGGLLDQSLQVCKLFVAEGLLLTIKGADKKESAFRADGKDTVGAFPIVVLVNDKTASAAEILAGVLHDHNRAIVLGTRTFGKGSVQSLFKLDDGAAIRVTTAYYYLPNGRTIHKRPGAARWGVDPDEGYYLPLSKAQVEELQKNQATRYIIGNGRPKAPDRLTPKILEEGYADPQLAAAQRTLVAKLTGGEFLKVGQANPIYDSPARLDALQRQREVLLKDLLKLELEIDAARRGGADKK
ncbi:MAG: S41 family peptidase [Gemmataceae bacterium]|nr:S41 family peptidase [Gemmataceae bacterium]